MTPSGPYHIKLRWFTNERALKFQSRFSDLRLRQDAGAGLASSMQPRGGNVYARSMVGIHFWKCLAQITRHFLTQAERVREARERERRERYMHIYIYIYTHSIHMYIYIYAEQAPHG